MGYLWVQATLRGWSPRTFGHVPLNGTSWWPVANEGDLVSYWFWICLAGYVGIVGITFRQENLLRPRFWQIGVISMVVGATDATDCSLRLKTKNFGQQKLEKWFHHSIFNVCISVWQSLIHHRFFFSCDHLWQPSVAGGCHHWRSIHVVTTWALATQLWVAHKCQTTSFRVLHRKTKPKVPAKTKRFKLGKTLGSFPLYSLTAWLNLFWYAVYKPLMTLQNHCKMQANIKLGVIF